MQIDFKIDSRVIRGWVEKTDRLATSFDQIVTRQLAEETVEMIREGFEKEKDPYGKPWAPIRLRDGRILQDSGGLKASWFVKSLGKGTFTVASAKAYAKFHQEGTGIYGVSGQRIRPKKARALAFGGRAFASVAGTPKRKMVPDQSLPTGWGRRYRAVANDVFTELMR